MKPLAERPGKMFWAFGMLLTLFIAWLVFTVTQPGHRAEAEIRTALPEWSVVANLLVAPLLIPIAAGPWHIKARTRVLFTTLTLASLVIAVAAARTLVLPYCLMLLAVLLEVYWLIPKWTARRLRAR